MTMQRGVLAACLSVLLHVSVAQIRRSAREWAWSGHEPCLLCCVLVLVKGSAGVQGTNPQRVV